MLNDMRDMRGRFLKGHKISVKHIGNLKHQCGENNPNWKGGLPKCSVCGKQISAYHCNKCWDCFHEGIKGENHPMFGISRLGEKAPNWKGDNCISPINKRIRRTKEYQIWRNSVFEKDNWTCRLCEKRGGNIEAHHLNDVMSSMP